MSSVPRTTTHRRRLTAGGAATAEFAVARATVSVGGEDCMTQQPGPALARGTYELVMVGLGVPLSAPLTVK